MIDGAGEPVVAVTAFLRELQASGRSAATQRSYAMDCCGGRFGWAIDVGWEQATPSNSAAAPRSTPTMRPAPGPDATRARRPQDVVPRAPDASGAAGGVGVGVLCECTAMSVVLTGV